MLKSKDIQMFQNGEMSKEEFVNYLIRYYPAVELASSLAELLEVYTIPSKITVTADEYKRIVTMFRIQGSSPRGRKKKNDTSEEQ